MILNNADDMMYGNREISRVCCGDATVWQRGDIPPEYTPINTYYMSGAGSFNTHVRPSGPDLRVEASICMHDYHMPDYSDSVILGGFNSAPLPTNENPLSHFYLWLFNTDLRATLMTGDGAYTSCTAEIHGIELERFYTIVAEYSNTEISLTVDAETDTVENSLYIPVPPRDLWLGSNGDPQEGGSKSFAHMSVQYLRIYDHGELVFSLQPVVRNSDGTRGFYDPVSGEFYA